MLSFRRLSKPKRAAPTAVCATPADADLGGFNLTKQLPRERSSFEETVIFAYAPEKRTLAASAFS
jgi:hypothetical protein